MKGARTLQMGSDVKSRGWGKSGGHSLSLKSTDMSWAIGSVFGRNASKCK